MAGGKETPRQKMIGMMYLVLTALLALNVSKEIVNAFVKLNDALESKNNIVEANIGNTISRFDALMAVKETRVSTETWYNRAQSIMSLSDSIHDYLMNETNELIREVEGIDWIEEVEINGVKKRKLKSLMEIEAKDEYDAPTRLFVGENPNLPNERGQMIRSELHRLRNRICVIMSTYNEGVKKYFFDPALITEEDIQSENFNLQLSAAMETVNSKDRARISQVYKTLSYPSMLKEYEEETSWQGGLFDHAPVVAACAMFTSLRGDVRTAEALALDHLTTKLEQPLIRINTIVPLAFAPSGYMNVGDTMPLMVRIAAYDSTEVPKIRYRLNDSTLSDAIETTGNITLKADSPGEKTMYGEIGIIQSGQLTWRPWKYSYEVGEPNGTVANDDMTIIYSGYPHEFSASVSGFPQDRVSLTLGNSKVSVKNKGGGKYEVQSVGISAGTVLQSQLIVKLDGGKSKSFPGPKFTIKTLPRPTAFLGNLSATDNKVAKSVLINNARSIRVAYGPDINLDPSKVKFSVTGFYMTAVFNGSKTFKSTSGSLTTEMTNFIRNTLPGTMLMFEIDAYGPGGATKPPSLVFTVQ
jgi:gliding motility-associated protein GldM